MSRKSVGGGLLAVLVCAATSASVAVTRAAPGEELISVDFIQSGGTACAGDTTVTGTTMKNAVGNSFTGQAGSWNALDIGSYNTSSAGSGLLNNGAGTPTSVQLSLGLATGLDAAAAGGWRCSPNDGAPGGIDQLRAEQAYLYNGVITGDHFAWSFTGLIPNSIYKLTIFGGSGNTTGASNVANGVPGTRDGEGDWNWEEITADTSGTILGTFTAPHPTLGLYGAQLEHLPRTEAPQPPPSTPQPADGAINVSTFAPLSWSTSAGAETYDVFLWPTSGAQPSELTATVTEGQYIPPPPLPPLTAYSWQVAARNPVGVTNGPVWTFTTDDGRPLEPDTPSPANAASNVMVEAPLEWDESPGAEHYEIYIWLASESKPATPSATVTTNSHRPAQALAGNSPYNWQVAAVNANGTTAGAVWTFTTGDRYPGYLVPWPKSVTMGSGDFPVTAGTRIVAEDPSLLPLAQVIAHDIRMAAGLDLTTLPGTALAGDIALRLDGGLAGEAYTLNATGTNLILSGGNYQAVAWASVTLLQALDTSGTPAMVPQMLIEDEPAAPLRTVMWDIARFFHPLETLYELVDLHRIYKVTYMHLFMSADGLFTFGTTAYPALARTNDGSIPFGGSAGFYLPAAGSRLYYTKAELTDLVQYAEDRGVVIVPEIDTPSWAAHMTTHLPGVFCSSGGTTQTHDININFPAAVTAVETIMDELADVFDTSPFIHIGGDEVPVSQFETFPNWASSSVANNYATGGEALVWFMNELNTKAVSRGKSSWAWSAPAAVGKGYDMPNDMVYTAWGHDDGQHASQGGYSVMRAAGGHVAGMGQATRSPPYNRCLLYRPAEGIYNRLTPLFRFIGAPDNIYTDLQPSFLPLTGRENQIVGAHIMEWETPYEVEVPAMRLSLPALGEPTWNQESSPRRNWDNFLIRQARTDALYERVMRPVTVNVTTQVDPRDGCFVADGMVTMSSPVTGTIRYTLGTDYKNSWFDFPTNSSTEYTGPFPITQSSVISARLFDVSGDPLGNPVTRGFFRITPTTHYRYFFTGDNPTEDFESGTPIVSSVMGRMDGNASHEDVRFGDTQHRTVYSGSLETQAGAYTFNAKFAGGSITIDRDPVPDGTPVDLAAGEHLVRIVTPASGLGTPYTFSGPGHGAGSDINLLLKPLDSASEVFPAAHAFGPRDVGAGATARQEITIVNHDVFNDLVISSVQLAGSDPGAFVISEDSGEAVLAPGAERIVAVRFDPTTAGTKSATLQVTATGLPGGSADVTLTGTGEEPTIQVSNLSNGETLRYSLVLVDGTYDGQSLQITAAPSGTELAFTTEGNRFRCLVDLQPGTNTLTITDGQGSIPFDLVFSPPTATDYRYKVWYVVPSDEAGSPVDPDWFAHFGLQAKLMQSWMAEDQLRGGNGRTTFYPELDASHHVDVGMLVVSQTRAQAEALGTGMYGQVWNQIPAAYKDGRHKNLAFSSVAFNALGGGDLCYVGAYTGIHPTGVPEAIDALLSTQVSPDGPLTYATYSGVTLHELIHTIHSIWHDTSPNNIMGGGGYDISQYFTLTYSAANPTPHNESGAGTLGAQRDLAAWNRYLMSADPQTYGDTTVNITTGPEYLTATSSHPLAVFQYYIPGTAADLHVNLADTPATTFSMHAGRARLKLGGHPFNVMAVDTEGNMSYATFPGTPVPVVPIGDSYQVNFSGPTVINASGVLENDANPSGNTLTAVLATNVQHGTLDLNANGGFTYTPGPGFTGSDNFYYRAVDAVSGDQEALVTLNAAPPPGATSIGWNYRGVGGIGLAPDDLAGAPGFAQDHWNNHAGVGQGPGPVPYPLTNDFGYATTARVTAWTLSMDNSWQHSQTANPDEVLMNDFSDQEPAITFSSIPYDTYDLVVYYGNNEGPGTSTLSVTGSVDDARSRPIITGNTAMSSHRSVGYIEETGALSGLTNFTVFAGLDDPGTTVALAGANNNGISAIQIVDTTTVLSGFALWQASTPGAGSSFDSNNDGDAWIDLVEYALLGDPATGMAPVGLPTVTNTSGTIDLVFSRPSGITDLRYDLEGSLDASNWFTITDLAPTINSNGATETLTFTALQTTNDVPGIASSPTALFRLRLTLP